MSTERWRPLRRRLSDETTALMDENRAAGLTELPVHLMLVDDNSEPERSRTACGRGLGEWVSGDQSQVTCHPCLEQVHA